MADIIKDDVQTYVRKLILSEFDSGNHEGKVISEKNRTVNTDEHHNRESPSELKC
jgi:hypothetical protein